MVTMEFDTRTAAIKYKVCIQTILKMIYADKVKAKKIGSHWRVDDESIQHYRENRWSRKNRKIDGKLVHDPLLNEISVSEASIKFKMPYATLYYYMRKNRLPYTRLGCALILKIDDIQNLIYDLKWSKHQP